MHNFSFRVMTFRTKNSVFDSLMKKEEISKVTIFREEAISAWAGFLVAPPSWSNWNSEMLVLFVEGGKPKNLEKNPQSKARTNNKLNPHVTPGQNWTQAWRKASALPTAPSLLPMGWMNAWDLFMIAQRMEVITYWWHFLFVNRCFNGVDYIREETSKCCKCTKADTEW